MKFTFTCKKVPLNDSVKDYAEKKISKLDRYFPEEAEAFVTFAVEKKNRCVEELTGERRTMVFHEAPHRLRATLEDMAELLGDRPAALCRELTKLHEDTVRTTLSQAAEWYRTNEPRGEYVLVVAGREKQDAPPMTLEEKVQTASNDLFSAYNTYCWAVEHGVLN